MVGVGRDLCGSPRPTPCPSRVTQSRGHSTAARQGWNISREGDSTAPLGSLGQGSVTLRGKKFFLGFRRNFLCFSLCPLPLVLSLGTTGKSLAPSSWHPPFRPTSNPAVFKKRKQSFRFLAEGLISLCSDTIHRFPSPCHSPLPLRTHAYMHAGRDWKEKVQSMGSQDKQLLFCTEPAINFSFNFFLASLPGQKRWRLKAEATLFYIIWSAKQMTSSWCRVVTSGWTSQICPTSAPQPPEAACSPCVTANVDGRCEHTRLCGWLICSCFLFPLSRSFTASSWARTGFHLDGQYNKEDSEIQITGGWTLFWKDITSLLWSSPTPSATDHSLDFIYFSSCLLNYLQNSFTS